MALIENAKGRRDSQGPSGYTRLFGVEALGNLISRLQGTVISSGTELEKLIIDRAKHIPDLDDFITSKLHSDDPGVWVATKKQVKDSKIIKSKHEPDFLAFSLDKRICYVIEVKDGDQFDTKKAAGEHTSLHDFSTDISQQIAFSMKVFICSFNAPDINAVWNGLKRKFEKEELLTGKMLCDLFNINYDEIIGLRTAEQKINLDYFITELVGIESVKYMIEAELEKTMQKP